MTVMDIKSLIIRELKEEIICTMVIVLLSEIVHSVH